MSRSLNKVTLLGNVGQQPEIRTTQDGKEIATLSLATSEVWKIKGTEEKKTKTEWHRIVVFQEGLVRIIKLYVKQGTRLYVEGSLQTRAWTDKNGQDRTITEIVLQAYNSRFMILDKAADTPPGEVSYATSGHSTQSQKPSISSNLEHASSDATENKQNNSSDPHLELMEELDDEVPF